MSRFTLVRGALVGAATLIIAGCGPAGGKESSTLVLAHYALAPISQPLPVRGIGGPLSILTYNVHGLPWPVVPERDADIRQMESDLRALRSLHRQPHIVVLQEAFTDAARALGRDSGYRFAASGPDAGLANAGRAGAPPFDGPFRSKGEEDGHWVDSGLQIFSDYPLSRIRQIAFGNCAGFDCLANKGAVMATIALPGQGAIELVTTHLNSRNASGVPDSRSLAAYRAQVADLAAFVRANRDPALPLVMAGDFNASSPDRARALGAAAAPVTRNDALGYCLVKAGSCRSSFPGMTAAVRLRARDWQFYANGSGETILPEAVAMTFGPEANGRLLSDHIGYSVAYLLAPARLAGDGWRRVLRGRADLPAA